MKELINQRFLKIPRNDRMAGDEANQVNADKENAGEDQNDFAEPVGKANELESVQKIPEHECDDQRKQRVIVKCTGKVEAKQ